jgi:hypothetical protein
VVKKRTTECSHGSLSKQGNQNRELHVTRYTFQQFPGWAEVSFAVLPFFEASAMFKQLLAILSSTGEPLSEDRHERKTYLLALLKDGHAKSLCLIIRDLYAYQKIKSLNDSGQTILKQARNTLLGEWGFVLSITHAQLEMHRLLTPTPLAVEE